MSGLALSERAELGHGSEQRRGRRRTDPLEAAHEVGFAREHCVRLQVSGNLGFEPRQGRAQAGNVPLEASHHTGMAGMLEPVGLGHQHLLHLIAPPFQLPQHHHLGRQRHIEAQALGLEAVERQHAGIDRIGLGQEPQIPGEVAHAGSVRLVHGKSELDTDFEHLALVAAGGLADDAERAELGPSAAPYLPQQEPADRLGRVGDAVLTVAGQHMHDQGLLGHLERDDVIEWALSRAHSHGARSVILDCMRPCEASLPFGWTRNWAPRVEDNRGPCKVYPGHDRSPPIRQGGHPA